MSAWFLDSKLSNCFFFVLGITQHPANDTYCEGNNAVLSCVVFDNSTKGAVSWFDDDDGGAVDASMISNSRDGDALTSVLTIESVSLSDNSTGYFCVPTLSITSYIGVISVAGEYTHIHVHVYMITCKK